MYKKQSGTEKIHREGLLLVAFTRRVRETSNEIRKRLLKAKFFF